MEQEGREEYPGAVFTGLREMESTVHLVVIQ